MMLHCPPLILGGFNLSRFEKDGQGPGVDGIIISSYSGEASEGRYGLSWDFNPDREVIRKQCTRGPVLMPCETIEKKTKRFLSAPD